MAFLETPVFPPRAGAGATFTLRNSVEIVTTANGYEVRNQNWAQSLREYQVALQLPSIAMMEEIRDHYLAVGGIAHGFRLKDVYDFSATSANGYVGTATTGTTSLTYQMHKFYSTGALGELRQIRKPVNGTITVRRAGVAASVGTGANQYLIDYTTGIITWGAGSTLNGIALDWAGEFDTPCRYDAELAINIASPAIFVAPSTTLREIRV